MPTKQNPGAFDCYKAALPDEPIFVILGRDPAGPATLEYWAAQRIKMGKTVADDDKDRLRVAFDEAKEMQEWRDRMMDASVEGIPPWRLPVHFPLDEDRPMIPDGISRTHVSELLDYATVYGAVDENSPNGPIDDPAAGQPMTDVRRGVIWAYKRVLGLVDLNTAPPEPQAPSREEFVPVETAAQDAAKRDERTVRLLATINAALRAASRKGDMDRALVEVERILRAALDANPPVRGPDDPLTQRVGGAVAFLRDGRLPTPHDLYRAVKNDGEGTGWRYESIGLGVDDLAEVHRRLTVAEDPPVAESIPAKAPVIDSDPTDLAHAPEVPHHRFSTFHKAGEYAYARGLEVNPMHLPVALDAMSKSGWHLLAIFGQTDSQHIGFIFRRSPETILMPSFWYDDKKAPETVSKTLELYQQGAPFAEIVEAATGGPCGPDGRGRGLDL